MGDTESPLQSDGTGVIRLLSGVTPEKNGSTGSITSKKKYYWRDEETRKKCIAKSSLYNKIHKEQHNKHSNTYYKKNAKRYSNHGKRWRKNNPIKVKEWNYKKYGLTYETYRELFEKQNGLCALCRRPPSEKLLVVDHDHRTNKVRGLLHRSCNAALGILGDSIEGIEIALDYLKRNS